MLPIVLAILISFLLAPVVSRLEKWGFHQILAVLSVATTAFVLIGVLCTTMSMESLDLVNSIPKYRDNIHTKWAAIQKGPPGPLNLALRNIGSLTDDLSKITAPAGSGQDSAPTKVQIVSGADSALAAGQKQRGAHSWTSRRVCRNCGAGGVYPSRTKTVSRSFSSLDRTFAHGDHDPRRR